MGKGIKLGGKRRKGKRFAKVRYTYIKEIEGKPPPSGKVSDVWNTSEWFDTR